MALRTSTWALYAQHEANLGQLGTILEPSWDHFEATWGSSVACFFVLRFSALRALILDSGVLLLCLAACYRDTDAHAKNTVKYCVLEGFARFVFKAGLLDPRGKQSARSFGKQAYSMTKATCFQHV